LDALLFVALLLLLAESEALLPALFLELFFALLAESVQFVSFE